MHTGGRHDGDTDILASGVSVVAGSTGVILDLWFLPLVT